MWSPTHVQVTVCRVKGLITKGKNGTNDCFVTISLGKEKFQTSVKQKALSDLEWQEECELAIPTQGNTAEIVLTALHQNFIGVDEFLGMVSLPLAHFDVYERPRTKWFPLKSKPGQEGKSKYRGEIEIRVAFTVKSGSLLDLSKKEKHKGSLGQISQAAHSIGGSLMNLGSKDKKGGGIKKLASSMGSKLRLPGKGGEKGDKVDGRLSRNSSGRYSGKFSGGDPDPGVISEDDDEFRFDELSHKSSGSSLNLAGSSQASGQGSLENLGGGELLRHNSMKRSGSSASTLPNRAIQPSSSSSSLTAAANANTAANGSTKSPQTKDWNQKLFGSKQNKVPSSSSSASSMSSSGGGMSHLKEESEEVAPSVFGVVRPRGSSIGAVASAAAATASAAATNSSSSNSLISRGGGDGGGVPSIIIQDSFVIQEPPSPTPTPLPTAKPRNVVVRSSDPEIEESAPPPSLPTSEPPPKPRHSRTTTTKQVAPATPVVDHHPTGEESAAASADDKGSTLFLPIGPLPVPVRSSAPRMPEAPLSSVSSSYFPVTRNDDDDDNFLRSLSNCDPVVVQVQQQQIQPLRPAPPVPKPRRVSPIPPDLEMPPPVAAARKPPQTQVLLNPFGDESEEEEKQGAVAVSPAILNPFEDDEENDVALVVSNPFEEEEDEAPVVVISAAKNPFEESNIVVADENEGEEEETKNSRGIRQSTDRKYSTSAALDELTDDELDEEDDDLNEESVCRWLEKAIEEHDQLQQGPPVVSSNSNQNVVHLSIIEDDDEEEREDDVNVYEQSTVDLFNDQTVEISPVLPTQASVDEKQTTPTKSTRRDRLQSLFSTPTSDTDERPNSTDVIRLNWMEDGDQDEDDEVVKEASQASHSQGFGGSGQLTSSLASPSHSGGGSEVVASLPMDTDDSLFPSPDLDAARRRRLSSILPPRVPEPEFTPPPTITSTSTAAPVTAVVGSGGSLPTPGRMGTLTPKVADLSWDNYDMQVMTTPAPASGTLLPSLAEEETASASSSLTSETSPATRKKRISLAPCLRTLSWAEPPNSLRDGGGGTSPLTEEDDDDEAMAAAAAATATSNETHRMKMAASFHQRVVVGEDKPVNNNVSRDNHHAPRDSPSSEDRHRIYQGRSREGLISLLEDRDNEIADLKDYIDCLLLRVIDTCPTVLQTPLKANRTPRK